MELSAMTVTIYIEDLTGSEITRYIELTTSSSGIEIPYKPENSSFFQISYIYISWK